MITPSRYELLAVGIGAALGTITAGGAAVAFITDDSTTRKTALAVAGGALLTAAGLGAVLLRNPATRPDAMMGALGFVGLPSMFATGMIQNKRDFG